MHTFFINTSGNELENFSDIFEIQHETRRLVSLDCPLGLWNDKDSGYKSCVKKMGELIDSYKSINNDFNLIIYVDLLGYEAYTRIPMDAHRERFACLAALRSVLLQYVKSTLVSELQKNGRTPQELLVIFEENQLPTDGDCTTEDGKNRACKYISELLNFPAVGEVERIISAHTGEERITPEEFCEAASKRGTSCIAQDLLFAYTKQIDILIAEAVENNVYDEKLLTNFFERIIKCSTSEDESYISFVTNRRADVNNKRENAHRNLRLSFYILACVEDETVFDKNRIGDGGAKCVKSFPEIDWKTVSGLLMAKRALFQKKYDETAKLADRFSEMCLAPPLYSFDHSRFGLNSFGEKEVVYTVADAKDAGDAKKKDKNKGAASGIIGPDGRKVVEKSEAEAKNLFADEFPLFDYKADEITSMSAGSRPKAEDYIECAKQLSSHHVEYLQRLRLHISDRLSNYAGRSVENLPALLRKRKVSIGEEDFEDDGREYRYRTANRSEETKSLGAVERISQTAFTTTLLDYTEFCAAKSVGVTDIEEQCDWFVTRVCQIKESLKKIKLVACGLLVAMLALYIPFVVIQWEAIVASIATLVIALCSIGAPLVLLYAIFAAVSIAQRRRYKEAWDEFKKKSDKALEENAEAARRYDLLLSHHIPALRWVYEYKLDVEFYKECCKMASAKISHHRSKLHDRVVIVGNIIEDLETLKYDSFDGTNDRATIDYNLSFCCGDGNKEFYSIIDSEFLKKICG